MLCFGEEPCKETCLTRTKRNYARVIECPTNDFSECDPGCGIGEETCENNCLHGNWGDEGCPTNEKLKKRTCFAGLCGKHQIGSCAICYVSYARFLRQKQKFLESQKRGKSNNTCS